MSGVAARSSASPAFGQADLSNCEREQIQLAGSIQPHGALLVVREPDRVVVQRSLNAAAILGQKEPLLGRALGDLDGDLSHCLPSNLPARLHAVPMAFRCRLGPKRAAFDGLVHRPPEAGLVIELERAGPPVEVQRHLESGIQAIVRCSSLRSLADETARIFRELTGYDRVMVYRFDDDGHGEVFSERRAAGLEPYLGNRYPATDIPQIARRLYERNRVRLLVDVAYEAVPIAPRLSPLTGRDLDMSLCSLRSMSPIHVQYLKNMGVAATLVASLVVAGRLWGLVACHHYKPRLAPYETRAMCELLAETAATRIAALESFVQAQSELTVRRLEQRLVEAISRDGDWKAALFDRGQSLLQPLRANGAALLFEDQTLTAGEVPGTQHLREIGAWLDRQPRAPVFSTVSLGIDEPAFAPLTAGASGLIAAAISNAPGDYLMWFRPERVRTVTWGGDPKKPMVIGSDPSELSPRRSFAQWHQLVEGTSDPWTPADLTTARLIGATVADVVLQFRAVRMMIAQNQLDEVSRQVRASDQPVIVADAAGRILLSNETFDRMLWAGHPHLQWLEDLPSYFSAPADVRHNLSELLSLHRPWRGEAGLKTSIGETRPLLVRADPVYSSPGKILGFVLLFNDLTERKAAEAARRRFQDDIVGRPRLSAMGLGSSDDLVYRNLIAAAVGNAQLAALEITDGVDVGRMPEMLEGVRTSTARVADILENLILHSSQGPRSD